jgi:hypothetical protein
MEKKLKITQFQKDIDSDVDELVLLVNSDQPQPARNVLVDGDRGIYLRLDAETDQIVGAIIFHAGEWFDDLARALANRDLNHPDLRFFLEKKLELFAEQIGNARGKEPLSSLRATLSE